MNRFNIFVQKIINHLYRYPKSKLKTYQKFGGYITYKKMLVAERAMQQAANKIIVQPFDTTLPALKVYFLTGNKFWHQTVFCAYSLQKVSKNPIHFTFYDDGTLHKIKNIQKQFPNATIVYLATIEENLKKYLPIEQFPYLHQKRKVYKHIRKLTDVYADNDPSWKLVLDSDMLFWKEPIQLLQWLQNPQNPFYILDCETAYGYPITAMEKLTGTGIKPKINVGAIGLSKNLVDFEKLEYWAKNLEQNFGAAYYLEQALSAMLIGNTNATIGAQNDYIVYPNENQVEQKSGVLHHYVDVSKKYYFQKAWKQLL